jgi:hypothetical protein
MQLLTNPVYLERLEGGALALSALCTWFVLGGSGWLLALCFLLPDLSMLGYLHSARWGAIGYNAVHSYPLALVLLAVGLWLSAPAVTLASLLLLTHIGVDRALGYGLKLPSGFADTHLGAVGKRA